MILLKVLRLEWSCQILNCDLFQGNQATRPHTTTSHSHKILRGHLSFLSSCPLMDTTMQGATMWQFPNVHVCMCVRETAFQFKTLTTSMEHVRCKCSAVELTLIHLFYFVRHVGSFRWLYKSSRMIHLTCRMLTEDTNSCILLLPGNKIYATYKQ